jgi:Sec-independent protein translocase protein TatA
VGWLGLGRLERVDGSVLALQERIMILLIAPELFGKKLPELGRPLGQALREFNWLTRAPEELTTVLTQLTDKSLKDDTRHDGTRA